MAALSEALVLGEKAGLQWRSMLEVFETSAVASRLVRAKPPTLVERDFAPRAASRCWPRTSISFSERGA
jgi:3-hydroxyisobutyrate dehydrogenase-like beta-hydroxyacid dehydrogenase